ncbi:MAG: pyruvate synthase subunit beta [Thermoprotei archaeon]|nr:MAG: pyruvate synthase subunit beta [Thermoprotei archaeon]RLE82619.1 MAG: pyruvate synthase subunit beta [Thermoprotei archaeon]RLF01807.1 MAG: pyruvate synthase subunit beta [Thermoprotei archaeon]
MAFVKTIKDIPLEEYRLPGHRLCAGCGPAIVTRLALKAIRGPTVIVNATGCVEVATTIYPYNSWKVPWVHVAFENAAAVASGIVEAFKILEKKYGRKERYDVIVFGGDGGTFDIGLQALSGALERGHDFVYICYDNEAYMNTGIQRSGATPRGAATTTSPAGRVIPGKLEKKKDLIGIAVAHGIPYAATASIAYPTDLINKVRKAIEVDGPAVLHILAPCTLGWRYDPKLTIKIARLATETLIFPIYEVENGRYKINIKPAKVVPVEEYLKLQGRFKHLLLPENRWLLEKLKRDIEESWQRLLMLEKATSAQQ